MATATLAIRYRCLSSSGLIRCEGDHPKRLKCAACGARLHVFTGLYGVFTWTGDGRYPIASAHRTFARKAAAERMIDADTTETLVVRWIPAC